MVPYVQADILDINKKEWERTREWDRCVTKMDAERLVKISRDNIPVGISAGRPKRRWSDLILD